MFQAILPYTSAFLCTILSAVVFFRGPRVFAYRVFALGMTALALEAVLMGLSIQAPSYADVVRWQYWRFVAATVVPGIWLLFSLSFARANYEEFLAAWRWVLVAVFLVPFVLVSVFSPALFVDVPVADPSSRWVLGLGRSGYVFSLFFLLSSALILMNLERTLRASTGSVRWQIKFIILGLGTLFAVRIYTSSQTLLFSSLTTTLIGINAGTLLVTDVLILVSLIRSRLLPMAVYLSQTVLYNSLTVVVVGVYLLAVGVLAQAVRYFGYGQSLPLEAFFVFLALLGLVIVLLSDEVRQRGRLFLSRHLQRPRYDYRNVWTTFTQQTASLLDKQALCTAVAKMVSETFGVAGVSVWLWDESQNCLSLGGSTLFSAGQARGLKITGAEAADFVHFMRARPLPIVCDREGGNGEIVPVGFVPNLLREAQIHYSVSLVAAEKFLGILTLTKRLTQEPLSVEDLDLLKTVADQMASSLFNVTLSQQLIQAKEMETFQTLSAFFLHDLKNLAAMLSLTVQNLPTHYDDPEFRADALRVVGNSIDKINSLCSRLSLLTRTLQLRQVETDVNEIVTHTLADLSDAVQATIVRDLRPVPRLSADPEQMQKVLVNLILNANEATALQGEIRVVTSHENGWDVIQVSDNGCGMSKEFMERSLFRPFQTTKSRGLGIGLYQSKAIVEAHHGRIEVESEEGKGSTFRVVLPVPNVKC